MGLGLRADFTGGTGTPRRDPGGKLELTEIARLPIAPEGIPEGFRRGTPERVAPEGAEAVEPKPHANESYLK